MHTERPKILLYESTAFETNVCRTGSVALLYSLLNWNFYICCWSALQLSFKAFWNVLCLNLLSLSKCKGSEYIKVVGIANHSQRIISSSIFNILIPLIIKKVPTRWKLLMFQVFFKPFNFFFLIFAKKSTARKFL